MDKGKQEPREFTVTLTVPADQMVTTDWPAELCLKAKIEAMRRARHKGIHPNGRVTAELRSACDIIRSGRLNSRLRFRVTFFGWVVE